MLLVSLLSSPSSMQLGEVLSIRLWSWHAAPTRTTEGRVSMITREQAIAATVDYLTGGLRRRLEASEGWPGEAGCEAGEPGPPRLHSVPTDTPDVAEVRASDDDSPDSPSTEAPTGIQGFPRRVWSVRVPDDGGHVGSSLYVIVDAETGRVFTKMPWGE